MQSNGQPKLVWGEKHDAEEKRHPMLMPYGRLDAKSQEDDKQAATQTLVAILSFNYKIQIDANLMEEQLKQRSDSDATDSEEESVESEEDVTTIISDSLGQDVLGNDAHNENDAAAGHRSENTSRLSRSRSIAHIAKSVVRTASMRQPRSALETQPGAAGEHSTCYTFRGQVFIYTPLPIDTTTVTLPQKFLRVGGLLAENAHEVGRTHRTSLCRLVKAD